MNTGVGKQNATATDEKTTEATENSWTENHWTTSLLRCTAKHLPM